MIPHILKKNLKEFRKKFHNYEMEDPRDVWVEESSGKIEDCFTSLIIKVAEGEIERLEKLKTVRHFWDGWFLVEDDTEGCIEKNKVYNQAIQDQISYWTSVKEEIIKNK